MTVSQQPILEVATGFMSAKFLFAANELGVFKKLDETPASQEQLAAALGVQHERLGVLLTGLVAVGLLEVDASPSSNSDAAAQYLSGNGDIDLCPLLHFWNLMNYPLWTRLESVLKTRSPREPAMSDSAQRVYTEGVEAMHEIHARALPHVYDFTPHSRILDIGGGSGSWLRAILQRHPHIRATLFERSGAAAIARERLSTEISSGTARIVSGDFFSDALPTGHDLALMANVMHGLSVSRNIELLERVRGSVQAGATLLLADYWTTPEIAASKHACLLAGAFMLSTGQGRVHGTQDVKSWLSQTGWRYVTELRLPESGSVMVSVAGNE
jgi:hypothetical protein